MSEQKSKYPDLNEVVGIATKFCKDVASSVKISVSEIVKDYKAKREEDASATEAPACSVAPKTEAPAKPEKKEEIKESTAEEKTAEKVTETKSE